MRKVSEMSLRVGHLPDPYRLDVAYCGGQPIETVERVVMDEPDPDYLGPYIRRVLREEIELELVRADEGRGGEVRC